MILPDTLIESWNKIPVYSIAVNTSIKVSTSPLSHNPSAIPLAFEILQIGLFKFFPSGPKLYVNALPQGLDLMVNFL